MDEIHTKFPSYGTHKHTEQLKKEDWCISRPTVRKYMREMAIEAIYPKPKTSQPNKQHKIYPYLLKGVKIEQPNQVWGVDITYIRMQNSWMYLFAILD